MNAANVILIFVYLVRCACWCSFIETSSNIWLFAVMFHFIYLRIYELYEHGMENGDDDDLDDGDDGD